MTSETKHSTYRRDKYDWRLDGGHREVDCLCERYQDGEEQGEVVCIPLTNVSTIHRIQ